MRENKKVLKFRKFKIANLNGLRIVGGADSVPTIPDPIELKTDEGVSACQSRHDGMCTEGATNTQLKNGCTDPDSANGGSASGQQVSG
ncbi:MAG: hypothetical protein AB8B65_03960 [Kordia sp.]|uniref:hypothetical protein n=1 Tax=Kordia sp. TaxID=1965332 RepID=UPI00385B3EF6